MRWRLCLLGIPNASTPEGSHALPSSAWPILGFLATCARGEASRDSVASVLWPDDDPESARHRLASVLWRLKGVFGEDDCPVVSRQGDLGLVIGQNFWVDTVALELRARAAINHRLHHAMNAAARFRIRRALLSLTGEYLSGADAEWILLERERLRCLRL